MTFSLGSSLRILVANWKNLFVSETRFRFCGIDSRISFLALAIASKKYPKPSVKLAQCGCDLAQSVKLGVWHLIYLAVSGKTFENDIFSVAELYHHVFRFPVDIPGL